MKTVKILLLSCAGGLALLGAALAQPAQVPPPVPPPADAGEAGGTGLVQPATPPADATAPPPAAPAATNAVVSPPKEGEAPTPEVKPAAPPRPEEPPMEVPPAPTRLVANGERGILLNFRNAPLELVLNYLSEAAGLIIAPETDISGKVTVWSNQPITPEEVVSVLNDQLSKNGFAFLRDGRKLTVVTKEEARRRDIRVETAIKASEVPKTEEVVTQIIPVRFINAAQLLKDLQPLLPLSTTLTANEGGNAIVITDTQRNIRRMMEIINALDTTVSSLSKVAVYQLKFADAKTVANMIKEVFATTSGSSRDQRGGMFAFMRGGGPGGMFGGGGAEGGGNTSGRPGASKVVATYDDRSNSLVVSAPEDLMPTIEDLVNSVDTNVEDVTEIRVFALQYSDPQEMADLLANLFPDDTNSRNSGRGGFGGFFRGPPGFGGEGGASTSASDRMKKQTRVLAVPDLRTSSVVVTAARDTMEQIARMIEQLDSNPAKKQKVFVIEMKNGDVQNAEEVVRNLFEGQNSRNRSSTQNRSALETREQQMMNQQQSSGFNTGFGTSGRSGGQSFR